MSQARFSVRTAVAEGYAFWRGNVLKAIGPLLIATAGLAVLVTARDLAMLVGGLAVYLLGGIAAQGALFRLALSDAGPDVRENGPWGLQWRGLETRLAAVGLLVGVILGFGAIVAGMVLNVLFLVLNGAPATEAAATTASLADLTPTQQFLFKAAGLVAVALLLVLSARLSLAGPATAADGRLRLLHSLELTRGAVLPVVGATLVINLPIIAMQVLAGLYTAGAGGAVAVAPTQMIVGVVSTFFYVPVSVGLLSYIYQRLREGAQP